MLCAKLTLAQRKKERQRNANNFVQKKSPIPKITATIYINFE